MIKYIVDVRNINDIPFGCYNCLISCPDRCTQFRTHVCIRLQKQIPPEIMEDGGTLDGCPVVKIEGRKERDNG